MSTLSQQYDDQCYNTSVIKSVGNACQAYAWLQPHLRWYHRHQSHKTLDLGYRLPSGILYMPKSEWR